MSKTTRLPSIITNRKVSRFQSVDAFRVLAIAAVVLIHTTPFETASSAIGNELDAATIVNQLARFAVPFFFVISGFFWSRKISSTGDVVGSSLQLSKRLLVLFCSWSLIYLVPWNAAETFNFGTFGPLKHIYWNLSSSVSHPLRTLFEGTGIHLWFLMGLLWSVMISALLLRLRLEFALAPFAVLLYAVGLAGKAYRDTPIGFHVDFNFRDGPFFSLVFFVTGHFLHTRRSGHRWFRTGLLLASVGLALHFLELLLLHRIWGTSMMQDYVVGTYLFGTGCALVALSRDPRIAWSWTSSVGPLVLGVYALHVVFVDLLVPLDRFYSPQPAWEIAYPVIVLLLSTLLARWLSRFSLTRSLVT